MFVVYVGVNLPTYKLFLVTTECPGFDDGTSSGWPRQSGSVSATFKVRFYQALTSNHFVLQATLAQVSFEADCFLLPVIPLLSADDRNALCQHHW